MGSLYLNKGMTLKRTYGTGTCCLGLIFFYRRALLPEFLTRRVKRGRLLYLKGGWVPHGQFTCTTTSPLKLHLKRACWVKPGLGWEEEPLPNKEGVTEEILMGWVGWARGLYVLRFSYKAFNILQHFFKSSMNILFPKENHLCQAIQYLKSDTS